MDEAKLNAFIGKILGDLGGAFSVPMVRMGDKLGLYKALNEKGPMTPGELAADDKRRGTLLARVDVAPGDFRLSRVRPCHGQVRLAARNRRWFSLMLTAPSICKGLSISLWRWWRTSRRSRPRFAQAKASAGAIRRSACSARSGASSDPVITTISWARGCRPWTASPLNWKAARMWLMLVAVTGFRPSSWRRRSRNRPSSGTTFTLRRLSRLGSTPSSTGRARTRSSKSPRRVIFPARSLIS